VLVLSRAASAQIGRFVLPAVHTSNFTCVKELAHTTDGAVYCLGIHPLFVEQSTESDLRVLKQHIECSLNDPLFAGIGEIGLDGLAPHLDWSKQVEFFHSQLKMAAHFDLPVVMHIRKAQDAVLKGLRLHRPKSGIAHAFNGSFQQAEHFLRLNMKLGFGGACTFTRALQLRRLVSQLPNEAIVLETDGPDMAPAWINNQRNEPMHLARIAHTVCELRHTTAEQLSRDTNLNAETALPALKSVFKPRLADTPSDLPTPEQKSFHPPHR
jgi:TatD DNase family protein